MIMTFFFFFPFYDFSGSYDDVAFIYFFFHLTSFFFWLVGFKFEDDHGCCSLVVVKNINGIRIMVHVMRL